MSYTLTEWMTLIRANEQVRIEWDNRPEPGIILPDGCSEHDHQVALLSWARNRVDIFPQLAYLYAIPNGGQRSKATAAKLKAEGVKSGIPDLHLPYARHGFHSLYIEMKVGSNKPSAAQREVMEELRRAGHCVKVCYSADEARLILVWYLGGVA